MIASQTLKDIYLDFTNNYLTYEGYARANGLTPEQATTLIKLARQVYLADDLKAFYAL